MKRHSNLTKILSIEEKMSTSLFFTAEQEQKCDQLACKQMSLKVLESWLCWPGESELSFRTLRYSPGLSDISRQDSDVEELSLNGSSMNFQCESIKLSKNIQSIELWASW